MWGKVRDMGVGDGQGTSRGLHCDPVVVEDDLVREDIEDVVIVERLGWDVIWIVRIIAFHVGHGRRGGHWRRRALLLLIGRRVVEEVIIVFFNVLGGWKIYMMIEESEVSMGGVCDGMRNK